MKVNVENSIELDRSIFVECNWTYDTSPDERYGYPSLMYSLQKYSEKMAEQGKVINSKVFILLAQAASMMLVASGINEPFKASFQDFQSGRRSALPDDFNEEELTFFENILNDVDEPLLKARLADLLWLLRKPRKSEYAKEAIDSYISHPINDETWHRGVNDCWERAARLCIQIKDFDRLGSIKSKLFEAMFAEYPRTKFMTFWIAELLDKLKIDKDFIENIAPLLFKNAIRLKAEGDFYPARVFFDLAARKFQQCGNEDGWLESLIEVSDCFELEADFRLNDSNAVANSFYEDAIQAYRRIPTRYRE